MVGMSLAVVRGRRRRVDLHAVVMCSSSRCRACLPRACRSRWSAATDWTVTRRSAPISRMRGGHAEFRARRHDDDGAGYSTMLAHRCMRTRLRNSRRRQKDALIGELEQAKEPSPTRAAAGETAQHFQARSGAMSHSCARRLNAILGFSEGMKSEVFRSACWCRRKGNTPGENPQLGPCTAQLINEILELSRIEDRPLRAKRGKPVDLAGRRRQGGVTANSFAANCARAIVASRPDMYEPELRGCGRTTRLRQICLKLLSNATKSTPQAARSG